MRQHSFVILALVVIHVQDAHAQAVTSTPAPPGGVQIIRGKKVPGLEVPDINNGIFNLPEINVLVPRPLPPGPAGEVSIPKLRIFVKMNRQKAVEVVSAARDSVSIYVARKGGLVGESFVPGDTILGVNGSAVRSIEDLNALVQSPGWKYVEGIDRGVDIGNAYIGRVYIE